MSDKSQQDTIQTSLDEDVAEFLINSRRLYIFSDIDQKMAAQTIATLQLLSVKPEPVYIYINSDGGYIDDGWGIINQMELMPNKVYTIVFGRAYSMAAWIAAYGTKGCRFATRKSRIMMHPPSIELSGDYVEQQRRLIEFERKLYDAEMQELAHRLRTSVKKLLSMNDKGCWMTVDDAKKHKMIDGIWTSKHEADINNRMPKHDKYNKQVKNVSGVLKTLASAIDRDEPIEVEAT